MIVQLYKCKHIRTRHTKYDFYCYSVVGCIVSKAARVVQIKRPCRICRFTAAQAVLSCELVWDIWLTQTLFEGCQGDPRHEILLNVYYKIYLVYYVTQAFESGLKSTANWLWHQQTQSIDLFYVKWPNWLCPLSSAVELMLYLFFFFFFFFFLIPFHS